MKIYKYIDKKMIIFCKILGSTEPNSKFFTTLNLTNLRLRISKYIFLPSKIIILLKILIILGEINT